MKIEVKRKDFLETLGQIQHVTERRAHQPILSHVLIKAEGEDITFFATDLEVFVKAKSKCISYGNFEIALPAKELYELIREIESEKISIEILDGKTEIKSKEGKYRLNSISPSQYPLPPEKEWVNITTLPAQTLITLIEKSSFAASQDESRYVLTGVLTEFLSNSIIFVASDGHRLAYFEVPHEVEREGKFVIPKNAIQDIKKILVGRQNISVKFSEGTLFLSSEKGDISIWIKVIDEEYPAWREVIPSDKDMICQCVVKREELKKTLKRLSIFAGSKFPFVSVEVRDGKAIWRSESDELGFSEEEIDADVSGKVPFRIALSIRYLQDALSSIDSSLVSIKIFGEMSPLCVDPVGGTGAKNLIMPIKL